MNLLSETLEVLTECGKQPADVFWVGDNTASCLWQQFAEYAAIIDYDAGYGGVEINLALIVVGADWWLERHEYDGAEWWEFKTLPMCQKPGSVKLLELGRE